MTYDPAKRHARYLAKRESILKARQKYHKKNRKAENQAAAKYYLANRDKIRARKQELYNRRKRQHD